MNKLFELKCPVCGKTMQHDIEDINIHRCVKCDVELHNTKHTAYVPRMRNVSELSDMAGSTTIVRYDDFAGDLKDYCICMNKTYDDAVSMLACPDSHLFVYKGVWVIGLIERLVIDQILRRIPDNEHFLNYCLPSKTMDAYLELRRHYSMEQAIYDMVMCKCLWENYTTPEERVEIATCLRALFAPTIDDAVNELISKEQSEGLPSNDSAAIVLMHSRHIGLQTYRKLTTAAMRKQLRNTLLNVSEYQFFTLSKALDVYNNYFEERYLNSVSGCALRFNVFQNIEDAVFKFRSKEDGWEVKLELEVCKWYIPITAFTRTFDKTFDNFGNIKRRDYYTEAVRKLNDMLTVSSDKL